MPDYSDRILEEREAAGEGDIGYVSKSRLKTWLENPEHFRLKYLEGLREDETDAMVRGTRIHETFEDFYWNVLAFAEEHDETPTLPEMRGLLCDYQKWADFTEPYISNFLVFETRRAVAADTVSEYLPLGIEEEIWYDRDDGPPLMGIADVVLPSASLDEVAADEGATVVDFKTGNVPDEKYRDEGIHAELTYYRMLFERRYNVTASAAYYPRHDTLLEVPDDGALRDFVSEGIESLIAHVNDYDGGRFPTNEGPLCGWSPDPDDRSSYYGVCPCTWNVPVDNRETFEELVESGASDYEIADRMGTSKDAARYWRYKLDI